MMREKLASSSKAITDHFTIDLEEQNGNTSSAKKKKTKKKKVAPKAITTKGEVDVTSAATGSSAH